MTALRTLFCAGVDAIWRLAVVLLVLFAVGSARGEVEDTIPKTRNSPLVAIPERAKLDPQSGGATYVYNIEVPPGTGKATPNLKLTYSSLTKSTEYGYGWSLNLSKIERSTRFGAPRYTDPAASAGDAFELDGELLARDPDDASTFYRRAHDGSRVRFSSGYWEVTQPDGTRMRYGSRTAAKSALQYGSLATSPVFRWALDEVIDPSGNSYQVNYQEQIDSSTGWRSNIYPETVRYSYHASAPPSQSTRTIKFSWVPRGAGTEAQDVPLNFRSGFRIETAMRLDRIEIGFDTSGSPDLTLETLVRRYRLEYAPKLSTSNPGESPFSKLVAIHREGATGLVFSTSFTYTGRPQIRDNYTVPEPPASIAPDGEVERRLGSATASTLLDINGDGIADRVAGTDTTTTFQVGLGSVEGVGRLQFGAYAPWELCSTATACGPAMSYVDRSLHEQVGNDVWDFTELSLIDMDGDGRPDYVTSTNTSPVVWTVRLNQGDRFGPPIPWTKPNLTNLGLNRHQELQHASIRPDIGGWSDERADFVDVNADGRPDHVASHPSGAIYISINNGSGFDQARLSVGAALPSGNVGYTSSATGYPLTKEDILDVNDDGLPDLAFVDAAGCVVVGFGTGNPGTPAAGSDRWYQAYQASSGTYAGGVSNCSQMAGASGALHAFGQWGVVPISSTGISWSDMNGDGVADLVFASGSFGAEPSTAYLGLGGGRISSAPTEIPSTLGTAGGSLGGEYVVSLKVTEADGAPLAEWFSSSLVPGTLTPLPAGEWGIASLGPPEGLLVRVTNEIGGFTTFEYENSRNLDQSAGVAIEVPPLPATVVPARQARWVPVRFEHHDGRVGTDCPASLSS